MSEVQTPAATPAAEMSHDEYRAAREARQPVEATTAKPSEVAAEEVETTTDADSETATEDQENGAPKKKGGFQKRIDKLTREKAELEAKLAATAAGKAPEKAVETAAVAKPAGKPESKDFETYEAFSEALVDWKADQREAAKAKAVDDAKAQAEQKTAGEKWSEQLVDARTRYDDFDKVALSDAPISQAVHNAIVGSENGADLAYFLGQNPAERERINKLQPLAATLALGKILASLEASAEADTPEDKQPKVSAAPPPIKPLGSKSAIAGKRSEDMSMDEYRKARESGKIR